LLGWIVLHEKVHWLQIVGIAAAAMGVVLVVTKGELPSLGLGRFGAPGDILILLSAPNWAIFSALSRRGLRKFPATLMIFYVMLFGWLFSTLLFLWGHGPAQLVNLNLDGWLAIIFLGVFGSGLAYIFWYDALQTLPIAQTGAFVYLEPFVTVIVAALFLSEVIGWASMVGGIGILLGIWLVNRPGSRRRPTGLSSG
jgi:drug/metabolite transporter (DMT)-like permease